MPIDTLPSRGSLGHNQLCGVDEGERGAYTTEGIIKLCEGLKGSAVSSLRCAGAIAVTFAFMSAPVDTRLCFGARSLEGNQLGPEGGAALAKGLKCNTTLQSLE